MIATRDYYGYAGNILYVDLSSKCIWREPLKLDLAEKFVGGPGIGLNILHKMLKPNIDPLSAENMMVFGTGPLTGTATIGSGKCYLNTKYAMPASKDKKKYFISTSMYGSNRFGLMMKNAGYDHIVILGRAEKPSYLKVIDDDVEICDAGDIWGKDVYEAGDMLRKRHTGKTGSCGTWIIGQAGENLVTFALGFADDWHNAGRFAAPVAGSKNLKAVVTLGTKGIKLANEKRFKNLVARKRQEILSASNYQKFMPFGSGVSGKLIQETLVGITGCSGGMCACKSVHRAKAGEYEGSWFGGIYPGFPAFAQMQLGIPGYPQEYGTGFKFVEIVNKYGLCVNTTINMLRFVTILYQRGVITREDMGGLELKIGDLEFYRELIEKIVHRKDIGAIMADGWYPLIEKLGVDASSDWEAGCPMIKGVDVMVDARVWPSLFRDPDGFSPAMGFSPIVHAKTKQNHSATYWSNKEVSLDFVKADVEKIGVTKEEFNRIFTDDSFNTARLSKYIEDAETAYNLLGVCDTCMHWMYDPNRDIPWLSEVYTAATGFDVTPRGLLRLGERVWTLEKMINVREGFGRADDQVPSLYLQNMQRPMKAREGDRYLTDWFGKRLVAEDIEAMLDEYYRERGWDVEKGIPTREKLAELGLEVVEEYLK